MMTPEQTYTKLCELLSKKYKNIDFNVELEKNSIRVEGKTIIGAFVVDLPFDYLSFEDCMILRNVYKGLWYECNKYIANVVYEIDSQLEELKNKFFFTDGIEFGWNGKLR